MRGLLVAGALLGLAAAGMLWRPGVLPLDDATGRGLAAGLLVGTAGSLAGFLVVVRNLRAAQRRFMAAVFGGMLLRLALFGAFVAVVLLRGGTGVGGFLAGLMAAYLGFQAAEVLVLHAGGAGAVQGQSE